MKLLTWNIYFGGHMFEERRDALVRELARLRPDVICLQEVTPEHLDALSSLPGYRASFDDGDNLTTSFSQAGYGVAILARVPVVALRDIALPSDMGRTLMTVELASGLTIGTVHLESLGENERRIEQFEVIHRHLAASERVVLCGDFNLKPDSPEQAAIDRCVPAWTDAWLACQPGTPGYTVDSDINSMRFQLKAKRTQKRIDRVLVRGMTARSIELVGTSSIDVDGTFVSDHFGLLADL